MGLSEAEVVLRYATSSRGWGSETGEEEAGAVLIGRGWASGRALAGA